jgi:hypothetical protein
MCEVRRLLTKIYEAKNALRKLDVIRSERFTGELGEWMAETACKGARAKLERRRDGTLKLSMEADSDYCKSRRMRKATRIRRDGRHCVQNR